jgi:Peptidase A4 family
MDRILSAIALITGTLVLAGSSTAAIAAPRAYAGNNALLAFPRANPPRSAHIKAVAMGSRGPHVVLQRAHLVAGPVHASAVATSGLTGYLDRAAAGVQFTFIKTYFTVPSVSSSSGCNGNPADGSVVQVVGIDAGQPVTSAPDNEEAGVAEVGCNGVTTADFFYNLAGYGAFYYSGVNPGDAIEASITVSRSRQYQFQVNDLSTGGTLQVTMGCQVSSCPDSSAEVFSQAQNLTGGVVPDFTMINYTGTTVNANCGKLTGNLAAKRGKWTSQALEETSPSVVKPSALQGGQAFSNTWVS